MITQKCYYHISDQDFERIGESSQSNAMIMAELKKADVILSAIGLKTYTEKSLQYLFSMPLDRKMEALAKVVDYASFVTSIREDNLDLEDDKSCLKYLIKRYGFQISDDFMNTIENGDAVEILDTQGVQIYRNYSLLMLTNYDVLSLCCHEWPELYARDSQITTALFESCDVLFGKNTPLYEYKTGGHLMVEKMSDENFQFYQTHKYGASVLNEDGLIVGLIISIRAQKIGSKEASNLHFLRSH